MMTAAERTSYPNLLSSACVAFWSVGSIRRTKWRSLSTARRQRMLSTLCSTWSLENPYSRTMNMNIFRCARHIPTRCHCSNANVLIPLHTHSAIITYTRTSSCLYGLLFLHLCGTDYFRSIIYIYNI